MVEGLVNKAFEGEDVMATRVAVTWFVLTRRFGVTKPESMIWENLSLASGSWEWVVGGPRFCAYTPRKKGFFSHQNLPGVTRLKKRILL